MKSPLLLSLLSCILYLASPPCQAKSQPNILWIFCEDLSPWMESYGHSVNAGKTPTLDKLSSNGLRFSRCYVPAPVCSACRSAMITGVYQTTTGTHQHRSSRSKEAAIYLPKEIKTLPQIFRANGYATFNKGKDDYNFIYKRDEHYSVGNPKPRKGFYGKKGKADWSQLPKDKPWFGQIQLGGGKTNTRGLKDKVDPATMKVPPYFPNEEIFRKEWAHHYDTVRVTDGHVKGILQRLKNDGLLENTIVFFFSDHGNNHSLRHKQFCYEGGVHVPLIISGPGIPKNAVRKEMISALDISATTLALAGIELPEYLHGQNLFAKDFKKRDHVVSARDRCDYTIDRIRTVRTEKFRYIRNFLTDRILLQPQYRDGQAQTKRLRELHAQGKLGKIPEWAFFGKRPAEELYDMEKDPHQVNNLATDPKYAAELKKHRKLLATWIKETDDKGEQPESEKNLRAIFKRWGKRCVNPEFDVFKKEKADDKANDKAKPAAGSKKKLTAADYQTINIRGWTVHVEKSLHGHPLHPTAIKLLDAKLGKITKLINPEILPDLKAVPIWLNKDIRRGACYHPNPAWLKNNQRMPEKVRSIELQNVHNFIHWSKPQPMMILHELAHAYHHRVHKFSDPTITAAFNNIVASKKYEKVKHVDGKTKRHYALSNEKEYFSECTEAYFGKNDFFPFNRAELKAYDPQGYAMVEKVWKVQ
ncbi:MAG: sulfatase-like hydrolase/transferase [Akkermansiaceae bacterium]